jgi:hypothetical protein
VVPHIGDRTSASIWTGRAMELIGFPCFESLTGGPRLGFELWRESEAISGHTAH